MYFFIIAEYSVNEMEQTTSLYFGERRPRETPEESSIGDTENVRNGKSAMA
jgi:hypothetical protein